MTMTDNALSAQTEAELQQKAKDHLWMHFARQSVLEEHGAPIIVKGDGHHIWDSQGRRYFDGLSGLFVVGYVIFGGQVGVAAETAAKALF